MIDFIYVLTYVLICIKTAVVTYIVRFINYKCKYP